MSEQQSNPGNGPSIWVLADPRPGTANQALGVAEALNLPFTVKPLVYGTFGKLPNLILGAGLRGLTPECAGAIAAPWPDVVISAGRRAAPVARFIKRRNGSAKLFHLMDPGPPGRADFTRLFLPSHDELSLANVSKFTGTPHRLNAAALEEAETAWRAVFEPLLRPRIGLLLGGATRRRPFPEAMARQLGGDAARLKSETGGSLAITGSPRTGAVFGQVISAAEASGSTADFGYEWRADGENPYRGLLAWSDALIVTGDSSSLITDACATGKPVYIYSPPGLAAPKHERLHRALYQGQFAAPFEGRLESKSAPRLDPAAAIAMEIAALL